MPKTKMLDPEGNLGRADYNTTTKVCGIEIGSRLYQYCEARLMGMTPTQAAKHAGYADNSIATKNERNPKVQSYLSSQREAMRRADRITRDDVINGFREAIEDAKLLSDPQAQIAGWREIGKMYGFYEPETKRIELTLNQQEQRRELELMAEDELLKLASDDPNMVDADFDFIPAPGQAAKH